MSFGFSLGLELFAWAGVYRKSKAKFTRVSCLQRDDE